MSCLSVPLVRLLLVPLKRREGEIARDGGLVTDRSVIPSTRRFAAFPMGSERAAAAVLLSSR